ncbi:MAG: di-heme-cytochrome C peroxidase [Pseudomonadota bacterium]
MLSLLHSLYFILCCLFKHKWKIITAIIAPMCIALMVGKTYQSWDNDPERGGIAIKNGLFGENYSTPIYLDQGWSASDSLWFYTTTQGSGLLPYDLFLVLEDAKSQELFRSNKNIDSFRYLPQKATFFNPDALPVGFVKDTYQNKDYIGFTCAACHTAQINYTDLAGKTTAIRIDGGPSMADMVGFLTALEKAMYATLKDESKQQRFIENVIALNNDFSETYDVIQSLEQWAKSIRLYNTINHSHINYGYARLDAFGRIYNRVLQHLINKKQLAQAMRLAINSRGQRILTDTHIDNVLENVNHDIILENQFAVILDRLTSKKKGYPGLHPRDVLRIRNQIFNEANAPVSYPFLWDIAQSDYVQWNGLANNSGVGPLGRNTGEVIGVFGILDWSSQKSTGFNLSAYITGQKSKNHVIKFTSSIDITNLRRLEFHLNSLRSPVWPQDILGKIDNDKARRGQLIYAQYCESCHEIIERNNWDRVVTADMSAIDFIGTDIAMATNSVNYTGKSGNLKHTVQSIDGVGDILIEEDAPAIQMLTSATKGVIATPDIDKFFIRRWLDRLYVIGASFLKNKIPNVIKQGNYKPDTTAKPYNSLLAYKARSLNGIWATAPYLHNGSVPTLYDLLLPKKQVDDPDDGEYRPDSFIVGSREFDPIKVGFRSEGYDGFQFSTFRVGDMNTGHEYGAGRTSQKDGTQLPPLTESQRWDLIEYLKTL